MASEKYTADDLFDLSILNRIKEIDLAIKSLNDNLAVTVKEGEALKKSLSGIKGTTGENVSQRQQTVNQLAETTAKLNIIQEKGAILAAQRARAEEIALLAAEKKENQKIKNAKEIESIEEKRLKRAEKAKNFDESSMKGMEQKLSRLRSEYAALTKVERENYELGGKKLKQITQLATETDKLRTATGSYQQRVGSYSKSMREVSSVLAGQIGLYGGIAGGVMLLSQAFGSGFNTIRQYSLEWSKLKGLMGNMSEADAKALQGSRTAGANLGQSATDVTKLQIELARFGLTAKEIVATTPGILKLATATGEDLGGASELVASNLKAFNLEAGQSDRLVGVLGRAFNESALGLSNFAEASKYSATSAQMAGVSFEQMSAHLAILADRGIKGSTAGTSLRRIYNEMAKTGLDASLSFDKIVKSGISVKDAFDEVGLTAQNALMILGGNKDKVDAFGTSLLDAATNAKVLNGTIRVMTDNLDGDLNKLSTAWQNMWLSFDHGEGTMSSFFREAINGAKEFVIWLTKINTTSNEFGEAKRASIEKGIVSSLTANVNMSAGGNEDYQRQLDNIKILISKKVELENGLKKLQLEITNETGISENQGVGKPRSIALALNDQRKSGMTTEQRKLLGELILSVELYNKAITDQKYLNELLNPTIKAVTNAEENQKKVVADKIELTKLEKEALDKKNDAEKARLELLKKNQETEKQNEKNRYEFRKQNGLITTEQQLEKELEVLQSALNSGWISVQEFYIKANQLRNEKPLLDFGMSTDKKNEKGLLVKETGASLGAGSEGGPKADNPKSGTLQSFLNFDDAQMKATKDALGKTYDYLTGYFDQVYQAEYDQYNRLYQLRTDNINKLNDELNQQNDLRKEAKATGNAFSEDETNRIKAQLIEEEKLRNEAIKKREEAAKKQKAIDTIEQTSGLITASANIYKSLTAAFIGPVGVAIASATVLTMLGLFAATKIKANELTKAEHGTFKVLQGDRHSARSGGINLGGSNVIAEGGEGMGIFSRNAMQSHGKEIEKFTKLANDGKLENYFSLGNKNFANFNQNNITFDSSKIVNEQKKTNEILSRQLTVLPDGKIIDAKGNTLKYL